MRGWSDPGRSSCPAAVPRAPAESRAPAEPGWIRSLPAGFRPAARKLLERLTEADVTDASDVAREELVDGEPAVVRVALRRRLDALAHGKRDQELMTEVVALLTAGEDEALDVRWRLVDGDDRPIGEL